MKRPGTRLPSRKSYGLCIVFRWSTIFSIPIISSNPWRNPTLLNKRSSSLGVLPLNVKTVTNALKLQQQVLVNYAFSPPVIQVGGSTWVPRKAHDVWYGSFPVKTHAGAFPPFLSHLNCKICQLPPPLAPWRRCLLRCWLGCLSPSVIYLSPLNVGTDDMTAKCQDFNFLPIKEMCQRLKQ